MCRVYLSCVPVLFIIGYVGMIHNNARADGGPYFLHVGSGVLKTCERLYVFGFYGLGSFHKISVRFLDTTNCAPSKLLLLLHKVFL